MSVTESLTTFGRQTVVGSGGARGNSSGRGRGGRGGGMGLGGGNGAGAAQLAEALTAGYVFSVVTRNYATSGEIWDPANTGAPNYGQHYALLADYNPPPNGYSYRQGTGGVLLTASTAVLQRFDPRWWISLNTEFRQGNSDTVAVSLEFLGASDQVLAAMSLSGANYNMSGSSGPTLASLASIGGGFGQYPITRHFISFGPDKIRALNAPQGYYDNSLSQAALYGFEIPCQTADIRKIRVSGMSARSTVSSGTVYLHASLVPKPAWWEENPPAIGAIPSGVIHGAFHAKSASPTWDPAQNGDRFRLMRKYQPAKIPLWNYSSGSIGILPAYAAEGVFEHFDLSWRLRIGGHQGYAVSDVCRATYEFQNASNQTVCALRFVPDDFQCDLWYGPNVSSLTRAPRLGYARPTGHLTFTPTSLVYTDLLGSNTSDDFTFNCNMASVTKIKVSGVQVVNAYSLGMNFAYLIVDPV